MDDIAGLERMELGFAGTALRQKLVNAVLSGAKTATASLRSDYEPATVDPMPVTGRRYLLVGSADEPVGVVEATDVRIVLAKDIDLQFARDEGEGLISVAEWRVAHERFWSDQMITDETAIVCERFRLVLAL